MGSQSLATYIKWNVLEDDLNEHSPNELKFHLQQIFSRLKSFFEKRSGSCSA